MASSPCPVPWQAAWQGFCDPDAGGVSHLPLHVPAVVVWEWQAEKGPFGHLKRTPHHFASTFLRRRDGDRGGREVTGWRMDAAVAVDAKTRAPRLGHAADDVPTAPTSRLVIGLAKAWGMSIERVCRAFTL